MDDGKMGKRQRQCCLHLGTVLIPLQHEASFSVVCGPAQLHQQRPLIRIHFTLLFQQTQENSIVSWARNTRLLERVASAAADLCRLGFRTERTSPPAFSCRAGTFRRGCQRAREWKSCCKHAGTWWPHFHRRRRPSRSASHRETPCSAVTKTKTRRLFFSSFSFFSGVLAVLLIFLIQVAVIIKQIHVNHRVEWKLILLIPFND